jgi:BirA family biotin operon repressor/biotin-[acetyl-CoA-carboxylase] ligase
MTEAARPFPLDIERHLRTRALGRIVEVHATISSTNDRARAIAKEGSAPGIAVVAHTQTLGRGQRGRTWHSPPNAGLYVSFLVRPSIAPRRAPSLTLLAGVALRDAVQSAAGIDAQIKWPNDLLARGGERAGRKLAGILVEVSADPLRIDHAVIGVGINVRRAPWPPEIAPLAASLEEVAGDPVDVGRLFSELAGELERRLDEVEGAGFQHVARAWTENAAGLNRHVKVAVDASTVEGTLRGIAEDGALLVETPAGLRSIYRGDLTLSV